MNDGTFSYGGLLDGSSLLVEWDSTVEEQEDMHRVYQKIGWDHQVVQAA